MSVDDEIHVQPNDSPIFASNSAPPINQFLKFLEIHVPLLTRIRAEPLIDYRHSQILTSIVHVEKLTQIAEKNAAVEEERAPRQKEKDLTKAQRATEKVVAVAIKEKRIAEKEARKIAKESWTTTTIRTTSERLQSLVKNGTS